MISVNHIVIRLQKAIKFQNHRMVQFILTNHEELRPLTTDTILRICMSNNMDLFNIAKGFLKKDQVPLVNVFNEPIEKNGHTILHMIVVEEKLVSLLAIIKMKMSDIILKCNDRNENILHIACLYGNIKAAKAILKNVCCNDKRNLIAQTNNDGQNPLHIAAKEGNVALIRILLAAGIPVESQNTQGYTALTCATLEENVNAMIALIKKGAYIPTSLFGSVNHILFSEQKPDRKFLDTMEAKMLKTFDAAFQFLPFTDSNDAYTSFVIKNPFQDVNHLDLKCFILWSQKGYGELVNHPIMKFLVYLNTQILVDLQVLHFSSNESLLYQAEKAVEVYRGFISFSRHDENFAFIFKCNGECENIPGLKLEPDLLCLVLALCQEPTGSKRIRLDELQMM
jgi:hypothetical protein